MFEKGGETVESDNNGKIVTIIQTETAINLFDVLVQLSYFIRFFWYEKNAYDSTTHRKPYLLKILIDKVFVTVVIFHKIFSGYQIWYTMK